MTRKEWEAISTARDILGLGEAATRAEIKRAYHRLSKKYHPDTSGDKTEKKESDIMYKITAAHDLLMRYCDQFRFPLQANERDDYDVEDWWMDRFGQDPLWGKQKK